MTEPLRLFNPDGQLPASDPTIADLADYWRQAERDKYAPRTFAEKDRQVRLFCDRFGRQRAESFRAAELVAWVRARESWRAASTRKGVVNTISHLFTLAARHQLTTRNPLSGISGDFDESDPRRPVDYCEYLRMLRHSTDALFRRFVVFLWESGVRPGEACSLRLPDIRWEDGLAVLTHHKTAKKTRKPRIIPLTGTALRLLRYIQRHSSDPGGYVFVNRLGRPWTAQSLCNRMESLRRRAGLPDDVYFHGIRHAWGTRKVAGGVPVKLVSVALGHHRVQTTERYYVHMDGEMQAVRRALEESERPTV